MRAHKATRGLRHGLRLAPFLLFFLAYAWVHLKYWDGSKPTAPATRVPSVAAAASGLHCTSAYPQRPWTTTSTRRPALELGPGCAGVALREALLPQPPARARAEPPTPPLRVLFVLARALYDGMTDAYLMEQLEACDRHPGMNCSVWGPGFVGFNGAQTLEENIAARHGAAGHYHIHFFQPGEPHVLLAPEPPLGVKRAQRFNEDWNSYNSALWQRLRIDIVMFSFAQDMFESAVRFAGAGLYDGSVFVHAPMAADPLLFDAGDDVAENKSSAGILAGAKDPYCYPMRTRLAGMVQRGALPGTVRAHPGYIMPTPELRHRQRLNFSAALRAAKLSYVTSSHYRYRLQKFSEVALSRTLLVGTLPQEREELFRDIMVELREDDTDAYIATIVRWWLEHGEERRAVARLAQLVARRLFTWDAVFAERLYGAHARLVRGEAGWWFAEPFTVRTPRRNVCDCNPRARASEYVLGARCPHVPA